METANTTTLSFTLASPMADVKKTRSMFYTVVDVDKIYSECKVVVEHNGQKNNLFS